MNTAVQQKPLTLKAFLAERLLIGKTQGDDYDFVLKCRSEIKTLAIASLVKEYYSRHSDLRLKHFDERHLDGQLRKDGKEFGSALIVLVISNCSKTSGEIIVTISGICL